LGGFRGRPIDDAARRASVATRKAKAKARAADLAPVIDDLRAEGVTSLNGIAKALTARHIGRQGRRRMESRASVSGDGAPVVDSAGDFVGNKEAVAGWELAASPGDGL
jgi:hypothetical protein